MRLNNESFEAMYCCTENDLTQRISIDKNLLFCTFLQKDVRESKKISFVYFFKCWETSRKVIESISADTHFHKLIDLFFLALISLVFSLSGCVSIFPVDTFVIGNVGRKWE